MVAASIFALIFVLAFDRGLIARALHAPALMKLGEWSFAIYMVHYIVMCMLPALGLPESPWLACLAGVGGSTRSALSAGVSSSGLSARPCAESF